MSMQDMTSIHKEALQFIQDIQQSSFLEKICFPIEDCVFAYVCGSRLTGLAEEKSDIDIAVVIKDNGSRYWTGQQLKYHIDNNKTIKVQWFPLSVSHFFEGVHEPMISKGLVIIGLFQFGFIGDDFIVYKNPQYDYIFRNFLKHKGRIQILGGYKFAERYMVDVCQSIETSIDVVYRFYPTITRLCYIANFFEFGDATLDRETLKEIKRRRNLEQHYDYIKDRLLFLKQYIKNNPIDIQKEEQELIQLMYATE